MNNKQRLQERIISPLINFWDGVIESEPQRLEQLKSDLVDAVHNEEYEQAKEISDKIKMYCDKGNGVCDFPNCGC